MTDWLWIAGGVLLGAGLLYLLIVAIFLWDSTSRYVKGYGQEPR